MPTYEYQCSDCETRYEVFHKVREVEEDIVCPHCNSTNYSKLISVTSMSMGGYSSASSSSYESSHSCSSGSCCGGSCGVN